MQQTDNSVLLRQYAENHSDEAFAELVKRHIDLVYSVALRHVGDPHQAEEVAQAVFITLAKKADHLRHAKALSSWLFQTTRLTASNFVKGETRRHQREQKAHMQSVLNESRSDDWPNIAPLLDDAVAGLSEKERLAIVLRFYEGRSLREVGSALGASEDAAQKRISRAVERLREYLAKHGVTIGASGLVVSISANAVQAAPVGLAITISTAAALAGTAVSTSTVIAATKTIAMTTLQKTLVAVTIVALAGAGIHEAHQAAQLRDQVQMLQQQQAPLAEQIHKLQSSFADTTNRLADLLAENSQPKSNSQQHELLKLRSAVAQLRNDAEQVNDPVVEQARRSKANVEKMKELFREHPDQQIPELQLLSDEYFFDLARDQDLESTNGIRKAFSEIRNSAQNQFAINLQPALQKFYQANSNQPPASVLALAPFFDPPTDNAILEHYHLIVTGKSIVAGWDGGWAISQTGTPDLDYDRQLLVSPVGFSSRPFKQPENY
jgi:RNA polymerase sigma factor (sigma-70 family)